MKPLAGKIAVVAGASRGAGRGIALPLGDRGATVYVAARSSRAVPKPAPASAGNAPGTVEDTAKFARVKNDHGHLDLLANSVWSPNCLPVWSKKFWDLSPELRRAATGGLIVHVTDTIYPDPSTWRGQILHDLGHECINRLVTGMSRDGKNVKIAVVELNPGFMRTERVLMHMTTAARKKQFLFDLSESPEYIGCAVAALAADRWVLKKTGQLLWACDLARENGFTDIDGRFIPRFDSNAPQQDYPV